MAIKETLDTVIQKVVANKVNVNNALRQAQDTLVQADDEAIAAAKVLLKKFEHPQAAIQILQNVAQIDALTETSNEMDAMIAGLQTVLVEERVLQNAETQLKANTEASLSPLPGAGGVIGADALADTGAGTVTAPQLA